MGDRSHDLFRLKIEDRVYTVNKFNPIDGMEFGMQLMAVLAPSLGGLLEATKEDGDAGKVGVELAKSFGNPELRPLFRKAFAQCFTPRNESLADEVQFNKWFLEFPEDMFSLGVQATWVLVKDFLPKSLVSNVGDFMQKQAIATTAPQQ